MSITSRAVASHKLRNLDMLAFIPLVTNCKVAETFGLHALNNVIAFDAARFSCKPISVHPRARCCPPLCSAADHKGDTVVPRSNIESTQGLQEAIG